MYADVRLGSNWPLKKGRKCGPRDPPNFRRVSLKQRRSRFPGRSRGVAMPKIAHEFIEEEGGKSIPCAWRMGGGASIEEEDGPRTCAYVPGPLAPGGGAWAPKTSILYPEDPTHAPTTSSRVAKLYLVYPCAYEIYQ